MACVSYTHFFFYTLRWRYPVQCAYIPPCSSSSYMGSMWRAGWECQFLLFFMGISPVKCRAKSRDQRLWRRPCHIPFSPCFQWSFFFLNKSAPCKKNIFFVIIVTKPENPLPRPPKLRGFWAKENKHLEKPLHRLQMNPKKPCQSSRLHDKSSETVAVISGVRAARDSSWEHMCRNRFLHVEGWVLRASLFLIWMW